MLALFCLTLKLFSATNQRILGLPEQKSQKTRNKQKLALLPMTVWRCVTMPSINDNMAQVCSGLCLGFMLTYLNIYCRKAMSTLSIQTRQPLNHWLLYEIYFCQGILVNSRVCRARDAQSMQQIKDQRLGMHRLCTETCHFPSHLFILYSLNSNQIVMKPKMSNSENFKQNQVSISVAVKGKDCQELLYVLFLQSGNKKQM